MLGVAIRQGYSWAKSKEMAERLKEDRMVEGGPSDDDGPDSANPPPRPDKSWVPTRRSPPRRKEKKEKKHKEPKMWKVRSARRTKRAAAHRAQSVRGRSVRQALPHRVVGRKAVKVEQRRKSLAPW